MSEGKLQPTTAALLTDPLLGEGDLDSKVLRLLINEYTRRLADYRAMDLWLTHKYHTPFPDFFDRRATVQHGSSWEVEKDALDWESVVTNIATLEAKLKTIVELGHDTA